MNDMPVTGRIQRMIELAGQTIQFLNDPRWEGAKKNPKACDFLAGNPQEMPMEAFTTTLQRWLVPQHKNWFAYKLSDEHAKKAVAKSLQESHKMPFDPDDITLTTGAFGALSAVLGMLIEPDDEVIYISPPWFFYGMMIAGYYGQPVGVMCDPDTFDLDLGAIRNAISPLTRAIIINSPNNPTGRIYPPETLQHLGELLTTFSRENQRTIYLVSDEAYSHILYGGKPFYSPTRFYPNSFLIYTYGKTLLTPGQRLGYVALPPSMSNRELVRNSLMMSMVANGFTFPNGLMQYALEDLEHLSIDVAHLQAKRDRMVSALQLMGYGLHVPEATFYLWVKSPIGDDMEFVERLLIEDIYCAPGRIFETPGYFRISLTASDEMIERSLPGFEKVLIETSANAYLRAD